MTALLPALLASLLVMAVPSRASAQADVAADAAPRSWCFRSSPLPECRTFWIAEIQVSKPLLQTSWAVPNYGAPYRATAFGSVLEWNVGQMVNVGPSGAVGALVTVEPEHVVGIRLRGRKWLAGGSAVDVEGGTLRRGSDGGVASGATLALRFSLRDVVYGQVRWDALGVPASECFEVDGSTAYTILSCGSAIDPVDPGTQHALSIGAGLGGLAAGVGTGVVAVGFLILMGVYLGSGGS